MHKKDIQKKKKLGFPLSLGLSALVVLGVAAYRGGFSLASPEVTFAAWSDAFFTAAVFTGGIGLLSFASSDGLFDLFRFGFSLLLRAPLSKEKRDEYPKTFYEYRQSRRGDGPAGIAAMVTGAILLLLAGLFLVLGGV